jgi:MFS transporter, FHS family, L-fucose permease
LIPETTSDVAAERASGLRGFVFALYFVFGGITSLNDVIIPKFKALFTLNYAEAMLVQSAFFLAYFVISIPASLIVDKIGYMRTAVLGLLVMATGCLLFIPAASAGLFAGFLAALFVLAAGITVVQVVANPLIGLLGSPRTAPSRLTFAQAFNSLGTTIFPYVGALLILGPSTQAEQASLSGPALAAFRTAQTHVIVTTYIGLALLLLFVASQVWLRRNRLSDQHEAIANPLQAFTLLRGRPRFSLGTCCIFLYVGAEVAIGSVIVNYLMSQGALNLDPQSAGRLVPLYWGGALLGRFLGAAVLRVFAPGYVLAAAAGMAMTLLTVSANSSGAMSGYSLLAIGLCNSIMFPTIFTLASAGLGKRAAEGSGVICVAIVGGAVVPLLAGHVADLTSLKFALLVPGICYACILLYGVYAKRSLATESNASAAAIAH